jgi:HB1, ASXL, restriction endonuclease HTH domain
MTAKKNATNSKAAKSRKARKPAEAPQAEPAPAAPEAPVPAAKMSALDAAAKVLQEDGEALGCKELIERMAARGYWSSPAGKTPASTLYSALLREVTTKGERSRFRKADRGKFALNATA